MVNLVLRTEAVSLTALNVFRDALPGLIFYKDIDGVYLGCNQDFCDLVGRDSESEVVGITDYDLFDKELADFFREEDEAILRSNTAQQNEEWVTYPDGSKKLLNTFKVPFLDQNANVIGVLGISTDITENHQAQTSLQESEEMYRRLFDLSEDPMWLIVDGQFVMANQASADLLGYESPQALTPTYPHELSPQYQPDGQASHQKSVAMMAIAHRKGYHRFEWAHQNNDGNSVCVEVSLTRIPYQGHEALFCIWRDITERKRQEILEKCRADIMEDIATKDDLNDVLTAICHSIEQHNAKMLCGILLLDDEAKHLGFGAAPSLPDFYNKATDGVRIGDGVGSCGTAAFSGKRVVVEDIQTHPYWVAYKELARNAGLGACWSEPIFSAQGKVLGTFAIYHQSPNNPTAADIKLIEQSAHLTSIAIERHQTKLALKLGEERWKFAIDGSGDGVWDWDIAADKVTYSRRWREMYGYAGGDDHTGYQDWLDHIHPEDSEVANKNLQAYLAGTLPSYYNIYRLRCKDDSYKWILGRGKVVQHDADNKPLRMVGTDTDITELKQIEEQLKLAASVFSHAGEGIAITDADGIILDVNNTFTCVTGYSHEEVVGKNPRILQSGRQSPAFYTKMWETLIQEGLWSGEVWNRRKNGEVYAELLTISAVENNAGQVINYVAFFTDITEQKGQQTLLQRMAHYDLLTNLPNRVLLADRLTLAMANAVRYNQLIAVLFLDLDGFKTINDLHGHHAGDELLVALSRRLKEVLRDGDTLSRIGGDEFVVVLTGIAQAQDCEPVLARLLEEASTPFLVNDEVIQVSVSIGVTIYPQDDAAADVLIRHADQAMYIAKQEGKNGYRLFDTARDIAVKTQQESIDDIRLALDSHDFVLYYQPKVNMKTGEVIGSEALIRWQHPSRGLLAPGEFLPTIENHELSITLGEWVIDSALHQIAVWHALGLNLPVSVNISAFQLQSEGFIDRLEQQLAAYPEVDPHYLELEVLETSELDDVVHVSKIMNACIDLGVNFALDDFGTGYASLLYIRRLPAQLVKIDQSFIRDMLVDVDDMAIVESVVALAKSFKRDVIAEGVETIEHGAALLQLGCELAQGYVIARPMPANYFPEWVKTWRPDKSWS